MIPDFAGACLDAGSPDGETTILGRCHGECPRTSRSRDETPQNSGSKIWQAPCFMQSRNGRSVIMKEADVIKYKALLMTKSAEIVDRTAQREDLWIVQSNEQIETIQLAGQREFAARNLERETKSLMQIGAALKRIKDGEFGTCLDCEEPISPKRLAAVPWAGYCLHCQEMRDAEDASDTFQRKAAA